jgi:hypothetical protein
LVTDVRIAWNGLKGSKGKGGLESATQELAEDSGDAVSREKEVVCGVKKKKKKRRRRRVFGGG